MSGERRIEVIDPEGWRKEFLLQKPILFVGSDPEAEIRLRHPQVAPRHLQLIPAQPLGFRLINLGAVDLVIRPQGIEPAPEQSRTVPPRSAGEVQDGEEIDLLGFRIIIQGGETRSNNFQVRLDLASTQLEVDQPLDGAVVINHVGEKAGVQFKVELRGYDPRYSQIEPGPVLFPGVERRVGFRLQHTRASNPPAGELTLTVVVTAPDAYPSEATTLAQVITVAPFRQYRLQAQAIDPNLADFVLPT